MYDEWGIADGYHDVAGQWHAAPPTTIETLRDLLGAAGRTPRCIVADAGRPTALTEPGRLVLDDGTDVGRVDHVAADVPSGYHSLHTDRGESLVVVAPPRVPAPPAGWGVAAQVYALWRPGSWGIGDLADVAALGQQVGSLGGVAVLLSPLHAPGPSGHQESSPYYSSSRRWLNPLHLALDDVAPVGLDNTPGGIVRRDEVWAAKRESLSARFRRERPDAGWRAWARAQGPDLWSFATWNGLAERFGQRWREWPEPFRHPSSDAVRELPLNDHDFAETCEFHAWLQWLTHQQLTRTADAAGVALINDLAVGSAPDGADAWLHQDEIALDARIGAPPDAFNAAGQDWGLPPFVPTRLAASRFAPFASMVRAACHGMRGLRIDHVMGLFRQYWIPPGGSATEGAYVRMPSNELLAIVRIEAERAGCFVVGEDLGTVADGVREAMATSGMLGTRVWWFDPATDSWPHSSLATVTTHDLPTVAGVVAGTDGDDEMLRLVSSLGTDPLVTAYTAIAASPSVLALVTTDDLAGAAERPNYPGTVDDLNWARRMPCDVESLCNAEPGRSVVAAMRHHRPSPTA